MQFSGGNLQIYFTRHNMNHNFLGSSDNNIKILDYATSYFVKKKTSVLFHSDTLEFYTRSLHITVADSGRGRWDHAPRQSLKIIHKKDNGQRRPHRFHVSRPPSYLVAGSATVSVVAKLIESSVLHRIKNKWLWSIFTSFLFSRSHSHPDYGLSTFCFKMKNYFPQRERKLWFEKKEKKLPCSHNLRGFFGR